MISINKTVKKTFNGKAFYLFEGEHDSKPSAKKVAKYAARGADINGRPHYTRVVKERRTSMKFGAPSKLRFERWYVYVREKPSPHKYVPLSERIKRFNS